LDNDLLGCGNSTHRISAKKNESLSLCSIFATHFGGVPWIPVAAKVGARRSDFGLSLCMTASGGTSQRTMAERRVGTFLELEINQSNSKQNIDI